MPLPKVVGVLAGAELWYVGGVYGGWGSTGGGRLGSEPAVVIARGTSATPGLRHVDDGCASGWVYV